jgi:hypothetical protein
VIANAARRQSSIAFLEDAGECFVELVVFGRLILGPQRPLQADQGGDGAPAAFSDNISKTWW